MECRLLGPLELVTTGDTRVEIPGAKLRGALAVLALEAGRVVSTDRLLDAIYGDDVPVRAENAMQQLIYKLRRCVRDGGGDDQLIVTRPPGYCLQVPAASVDALRFEQLVKDGREASGLGQFDRAKQLYASAFALWRGTPMADVTLAGVVTSMRTRLEEIKLTAEEDRIDVELELGHAVALVPELEAMVATAPFRERRWSQLITVLYRADRQGDALRAYQQVREMLADELGIEPGADLRRLEIAVLNQDPALGRSAGSAVHTIGAATVPAASRGGDQPVRRVGRPRRPITRCVGRDVELRRLADALSSAPLITLVGPGGAGKTRLAAEVATTFDSERRDGCIWIELAPIGPGEVANAMARSLGLDELGRNSNDDAATDIIDALRHRETLLVVDNCEHVLEEVADVIELILDSCGSVQVLATSREGLAIGGEVVFPVLPLPLADAKAIFIERVRAAGVELRSEELVVGGDVEVICERLDGLPLALELAAARVRHLGVAEVATRLDQRFEVLSGGPRTSQARQRTLRSVVDWSYGLLDQEERAVFDRMGVFARDATLASAVRVCSQSSHDAPVVESVLSRLVDKSLLMVDRSAGSVRYRLLQTLGDYARERLIARGEEAGVRRRHAEWVRDLASTVEVEADVPDRRAAALAVHAEDVEIRAAIAWALGAEPTLALDIATRLGYFWTGTLQTRTAWAYLTLALDAAIDAPPEMRAHAHAYAGLAGGTCGEPAAEAHAEAAVEFERAFGDPRRLGRACSIRGCELTLRSQGRAALPWLEEARRCFAASGDTLQRAHASMWTGNALALLGEHAEAKANLDYAVEVFQRLGDHIGTLGTLVSIAFLAQRAGDRAEADTAYEQLSEMATGAIAAIAAANLAVSRLERGDLDGARRLADDAIAGSLSGFSPSVAAHAHLARGLVAAACGEHLAARADLDRAARFGRDSRQGAVVVDAFIALSRIAEAATDPEESVLMARAAVAEAGRSDDVLATRRALMRAQELDAELVAGS